MCGFTGYFGKNLNNSKSVVSKMLKSINHRGPDHEGYYYSENFHGGFCRLSIIDLTKSSNQPFYINQNDNLILFFNGEIYNYLELKKDLEIAGVKFRTSSDTEVLYNCILHFGIENFASHLIGMFSIVCYRPITNDVFLIRDQLGIKPLYFTEKKNNLYFSSETKAFNHLDLKLNKGKVVEYLSIGTNIGEETMYDNVYSVLPGQLIKVSLNKKKQKLAYFKLLESFKEKRLRFHQDELDNLLSNTIAMHTRSDVKFGCQFSGGLDSSLLTSFVSKLERQKIKGFSVSVDHNFLDESIYQKSLSKLIGFNRSEVLFGINEFCDQSLLETYNFDFDFPLHHPNIVASNLLNEKASSEGFKVLLSGDGADEFFAGYSWQFDNTSNPDKIIENGSYIDRNLLISSLNVSDDVDYSDLKRDLDSLSNNFDKQLFFDQYVYLQKWLTRQDRSGMRSSLELRVPFCSSNITTFINSLDFDIKTNHKNTTKFLLKKFASKYLPNSIVNQKKVGFSIPIDDWFRSAKTNNLINFLLEDETFDRGVFIKEKIKKIIELHKLKKANFGRILWSLINFEIWCRKYFS